jgi:antitoxin component YwqK of YwqJK toxin-antitoxin module
VLVEHTYYESYGAEFMHGTSKGYWTTGELQRVTNYKDGKEDGVAKVYYQDGKLSDESTWKMGVLDGPAKSYYPNGQLKKECVYKGVPIVPGTRKDYNEDGSFEAPTKSY